MLQRVKFSLFPLALMLATDGQGCDGCGTDPNPPPVTTGCTTNATCDAGFYCSAGACVKGCNDGAQCASGVCTASHDCLACVGASECAAGKTCTGGSCVVPCTGPACSAPATFGDLCTQTRYTAVLDGIGADEAATLAMKAAITSKCAGVTIAEASMNDASIISLPSHRPNSGPSNSLLLGGGSFFNQPVAYLQTGATPVVEADDDGTQLNLKTRAGTLIVNIQYSALSASHDYFVLEIAKEPVSQTTSVIAYGIFDKGTMAAARYFAGLPSNSTAKYIVGEWTNADADSEPSAGDTFTVVASGN